MISRVWLIVPALTAVGGAIGAYQATQEVSAVTYGMLIDAAPRLKEPTRQALRDALSDGQLTQWEYKGIEPRIFDEAIIMRYSSEHDGQQLSQERARETLSLLLTVPPLGRQPVTPSASRPCLPLDQTEYSAAQVERSDFCMPNRNLIQEVDTSDRNAWAYRIDRDRIAFSPLENNQKPVRVVLSAYDKKYEFTLYR